MNVVGERIRSLRNAKGWSQEELAHRAGISASHMGRLERGERGATVHSLEKVTRALGITFVDLFRFLNEDAPEKDSTVIYEIVQNLNNRSPKEQKIILNLINVLPPWGDDK